MKRQVVAILVHPVVRNEIDRTPSIQVAMDTPIEEAPEE